MNGESDIDQLKAKYNLLEIEVHDLKMKLKTETEEKLRLRDALYPTVHKKRPYFEVNSKSGQKLRYNKIRGCIEALSTTLEESDSVQIGKVEIYKKSESRIPLQVSILESPRIDISLINSTENCILAKDENFVADKKYEKLSSDLHLTAYKIVKTSYALKKGRKKLNAKIQIKQIENTQAFFYDDMAKTMFDRIHFFLQQKEKANDVNSTINLEQSITVKLSFDQTNICKKIKLINFTFCLIDEKKKAQTAAGNYTLGIIDHPDNYENLKLWCPYAVKKLKDSNEMFYNGARILIKPTFASDMAATTSVMGLFGSKSSFPCFLCEVHRDNLANYKVSYDKRSRETQDAIMKNDGVHPTKLYKNKKVHWGYAHPSLLDDYISYNQLVVEILHMWLRITGKLFQLLARDIADISKVELKNLSVSDHVLFKTYFDYLHNTCGFKSLIPCPKVEKGVESLHRDLNGNDTEKFVEKLLYLKPLFDFFEDGISKYRLWTFFYKIYIKLRHEGYSSGKSLQEDTSKWMELYLYVYNAADEMTPYIHIFASHLHEQMDTFGNISYYCTQGLEKLNDLTTKEYQFATNKHQNYVSQILRHRARRSLLQMQKYQDPQ